MRPSELDRHPYLGSSPCERCASSSGGLDINHCLVCHGTNEVFDLRVVDIDLNTSIRIGDLLLQKSKQGRLRGRFKHWRFFEWQEISCDAGLHTMLRNVRDGSRLVGGRKEWHQ
jgi:hypothetical protein